MTIDALIGRATALRRDIVNARDALHPDCARFDQLDFAQDVAGEAIAYLRDAAAASAAPPPDPCCRRCRGTGEWQPSPMDPPEDCGCVEVEP